MKKAFLILFMVVTSLSELVSLNAQTFMSMNQQQKKRSIKKKNTSTPVGIIIANAELRSEPWPRGKVLVVLPKGVRVRALASITINTLELYTIWVKVKVLQWPVSRPPNAPDTGWVQVSLVRVEEPGETAQAQTDRRELKVQPAESINQWPTGTKRFALIIGVDEYQDRQINKLLGASNDAKALSDALVRYAGFPRNQVILLASDQPVDHQPTRSNIMRKLSDIRQAAPKDGLLLISFSGHGFERNGHAYLLPMDTQLSEDIALLEESAINVETLRERIRQTEVRQVVIILDACRNNPLSGKGATSTPLTNTYIRGFNFDIRNQEITAFATLYSTGVGQLAYEDKDRKQGYFTLAMVEGLKGSAANERGEVTLARLVDFVQETVPKRTAIGVGNQQKPFAVIDGYKANDLVISVGKPASLIKPNSQTEQPSAISVKPVPDNPIVKDDDEPNIERIEIGKSKNGTIVEGQYKDYLFDGVANSPLLFTIRAGERILRNITRYTAGIYDFKGRQLREPINIFPEHVQEIPFTPPTNGQYIIRLKGERGRCNYTIYLDRP